MPHDVISRRAADRPSAPWADVALRAVRAYLGAGTREEAAAVTAADARLHVSGYSPLAGEFVGRQALLGWRARLIGETCGRFTLVREGPVRRSGDRVVVRVRERMAWGDAESLIRVTVLARVEDDRVVELSIRPEGDSLDRLMRRRPSVRLPAG
jgi:hypothetical protein